MIFVAVIRASKAGSIGEKYGTRREYEIETDRPDHVNDLAIKRAHDEGLEHVIVVRQWTK